MVQAPAERQLAMLGFTTAGVAASSLAAAWQSSIGNVAAGSAFAWFQAAGATGLLSQYGSAALVAAAAIAAGAGSVRSIYPAK